MIESVTHPKMTPEQVRETATIVQNNAEQYNAARAVVGSEWTCMASLPVNLRRYCQTLAAIGELQEGVEPVLTSTNHMAGSRIFFRQPPRN